MGPVDIVVENNIIQSIHTVGYPGVEIKAEDRFARNLNTGGNNYDEKESVIAHNKVHHSSKYSSHIKLPMISN